MEPSALGGMGPWCHGGMEVRWHGGMEPEGPKAERSKDQGRGAKGSKAQGPRPKVQNLLYRGQGSGS